MDRKQNAVHSWRRCLREPLLHFVAIGLALSAATSAYQHHTDARRIVLTPQHVAQLANIYTLQFGRAPDERTLQALIDRDTRDEVLYREGRALGLDSDDVVVRRRIIQKMQFFTEGLNPPPEPTDAQLQAYFAAHPSRYMEPSRVTFSHIYFAAGKDVGTARARAERVKAGLADTVVRAPERGDPFPDAYDYVNQDAEQLQRLFGATQIADTLRDQAAGGWVGPVQSAYGLHLVRVSARSTPQRVALGAVRERVRTDYLLDAQARSNQLAFERLASRYTVLRQKAEQ